MPFFLLLNVPHLQRSAWFDLPVKLVVNGGILKEAYLYFMVIVAAVTSTSFYCIQHFLWACLLHYLISIIPLVNHEQIHNSIMVQFICCWILTTDRAQYNTEYVFILHVLQIFKRRLISNLSLNHPGKAFVGPKNSNKLHFCTCPPLSFNLSRLWCWI